MHVGYKHSLKSFPQKRMLRDRGRLPVIPLVSLPDEIFVTSNPVPRGR